MGLVEWFADEQRAKQRTTSVKVEVIVSFAEDRLRELLDQTPACSRIATDVPTTST